MKKRLFFIITTITLMLSSVFTAFAEEESSLSASSESVGFSLTNALKALAECPVALVAAIISFILVVMFIILRKKLTAKLNNSNSKQMITAFIVFFAVNGIACLIFGLLTEGVTWSHMMHIDNSETLLRTQFADFFSVVRFCASRHFSMVAEDFTPLGMLLYFLLAQFMPSTLVLTDSYIEYLTILRNQSAMLLYLFIVIFCIVFMYRMTRSVLRRNNLTVLDEIVAFLMVVSFPTMYCIEMGNIIAISVVLIMFFILFRDSDKKVLRELSLLALGVSAGITPYSLVFALFLLISKDKPQASRFIRTCVYFVILFIAPAFFTGFGNALKYVVKFISIPEGGFISGSSSITNLLVFFGAENKVILYAVFLLTEIIAAICLFVLPHRWQKAAAAIYIMLNIFSVSDNMMLIFIFIPFIFLLGKKEHKAIDWLYLLAFSLIITPFPEWYYFDSTSFTAFLNQFGLDYIFAANNLISLAAVQMIFILLFYQMTVQLRSKNKQVSVTETTATEQTAK